MTIAALASEWERLDLLAVCAGRLRMGEPVPEEATARLEVVQRAVAQGRSRSPWRDLLHDCPLTLMDQDVLVCALAPEAEPRLGWMFQELQAGVASAFPTPALVQELYCLDGDRAGELRARLRPTAPLLSGGLLEPRESGSYRPIMPTTRAQAMLLNWPGVLQPAPPGTVPIPARGRLADLVLPRAGRRALHEFLLWVTHRDQVFGQWGAKPHGGPVALFTGPSGTGKTFAAEAVANVLGWSLFRVDLGLLVSKYVGETEKNLTALFEAAHGQRLVLLFDEADSLFGKRGEVRDARDRYANMEISHLLARIERHQGPCILTTNLRQHLDPAFARRFQLVVDFPRPDAAARLELWARHLPPRAPRAPDLNLTELAAAVPLTGGQIRNVALHAAFLAAGECMPITWQHLASAVWTELAKEGREVVRANLGSLERHLPAEAA